MQFRHTASRAASRVAICGLLSLSCLVGCQNEKEKEESTSEFSKIVPHATRAANLKIEDSFRIEERTSRASHNLNAKTNENLSVAPLPEESKDGAATLAPLANPLQESLANRGLGLDRANILIKKEALGKEFLMMSSNVTQEATPMFSGAKSRVVFFKQVETEIYMFESLPGHAIDLAMPQHFLLAKFPILSTTEKEISFDFNKGMTQLFTTFDWYAQDFSGSFYARNDSVAKVELSYIESAEQIGNHLVIRQIAQIPDPWVGQNYRTTWEVRYFLTPYAPNPNFKALTSPGFDRVGFFEVQPYLTENGLTVVRASKFDENKNIKYAISANTPAEVKPAIRDAVLYWNKAFGRNLVEVEELTETSITAPSPVHNVIQWVSWETAPFAYADAQMDPRTGEILHAQVYMPNGWLFYTRADAEKLLARLANEETKSLAHRQRRGLKIRGFAEGPNCHRAQAVTLKTKLTHLLASPATDAAIHRFSLDHIREVMAHEIGHTLGLRHNFGGTVSATYTASEGTKHFKSYMETGVVPPGVIPSSSVMDYTESSDAAMLGALVRSSEKALPYDAQAIGVLYNGVSLSETAPIPFCTDSGFDQGYSGYLDCAAWDSGSSRLESLMVGYNDQLQNLPLNVIFLYINAKSPAFPEEQTVTVKNLKLSADILMGWFKFFRETNYNFFLETRKLIQFHSQQDFVSDINQDLVRKEENQWIAGEIKRLGGLNALFAPISHDYVKTATDKFSKLLDKPQYTQGTFRGKAFSFTQDEKSTMKAKFELLAQEIVEKLTENDLRLLSGAYDPDLVYWSKFYPELLPTVQPRVIDDPIATDLAGVIQNHFRTVALTRTSNAILGTAFNSEGQSKPIYLPNYKYPYSLRAKAAEMFAMGRGQAVDWLWAERETSRKGLNDEALLLPYAPDKIDYIQSSPEVRRWALENKKLLSLIPTE